MSDYDDDWIELTLIDGIKRGFRRSQITGHWRDTVGDSCIEWHNVTRRVREPYHRLLELLRVPPQE